MQSRMHRMFAAVGMIAVLGAAVQAAEPPRRADDPVAAALVTMIDEEQRAAAAYQRVLLDFPEARPFAAMVRDEDLHAELVAALFRGRGLRVPASRWAPERLPAHRSLAGACRAAADAERRNLALYDGYLSAGLPKDVRHVFEHNRRASERAHVPAFERCAAGE